MKAFTLALFAVTYNDILHVANIGVLVKEWLCIASENCNGLLAQCNGLWFMYTLVSARSFACVFSSKK